MPVVIKERRKNNLKYDVMFPVFGGYRIITVPANSKEEAKRLANMLEKLPEEITIKEIK